MYYDLTTLLYQHSFAIEIVKCLCVSVAISFRLINYKAKPMKEHIEEAKDKVVEIADNAIDRVTDYASRVSDWVANELPEKISNIGGHVSENLNFRRSRCMRGHVYIDCSLDSPKNLPKAVRSSK